MVYNTGNADTTGTGDGSKIRGGETQRERVLSSWNNWLYKLIYMNIYLWLALRQSGFGHIGITVPNVYTACDRFHKLGVPFHKSPNAGGMKGLAFIKDPDGYLIEVLPQGEMIVEDVDCLGVLSEGGEGYKDNSKWIN